MDFDPVAFTRALDRLRRLWTDVQIELEGPYDSGKLGYASSRAATDEEAPVLFPGGAFPEGSNHRELRRRAWSAKARAEWEICDAQLRAVPALSWPGLHWTLQFCAGNGCVMYRLVIAGTPLARRHVATSAHAAKRLAGLCEAFPGWHTNGARYALDGTTFAAATIEDALRLRAALSPHSEPPRRTEALPRLAA